MAEPGVIDKGLKWLQESAEGAVETVKPHVEVVGGAIANAVDEAGRKAKELTGKANDASDNWLGDNKGLLVGLGLALLSIFSGIEGVFIPLLLATVAVVGGAYFDKEDGIFGGIFKKNEKNDPITHQVSAEQAISKPTKLTYLEPNEPQLGDMPSQFASLTAPNQEKTSTHNRR